jgi:hypothetical protein
MVKYTIKEGEIYGLWTTLSKVDGLKTEKWMCRCSCGTVKDVFKSHLYSLASSSCGCVGRAKMSDRNFSHGLSGTKEHNTWLSIKTRCTNKNHKDFKDYGGKGIVVADYWKESFLTFLSDMGNAPTDGQLWSIGRLDNSVGYCKENCRWETADLQSRNKTMLCTNTSGTTGVIERLRNGRISFSTKWVDLGGVSHCREFSALKWGYDNARRLAESARKAAIASLNEQGAQYSENHGL